MSKMYTMLRVLSMNRANKPGNYLYIQMPGESYGENEGTYNE
jgi:hypothetical protein